MKVVYHLGAQCTDEQKLISCLRSNVGVLAEQSIIVPDPAVYRPILREVLNAMKGAPSSLQTEETVLDAVMVQDEADRIIFSHDMLLSAKQRALSKGMLYANAAEKVQGIVNLLPSHDCEIFMAIRNPATFVPALFQSAKTSNYSEFIGATDPLTLSWSNMIERIRELCPDTPITLWCDEDTPLIWQDVLQAVTQHAPGTVLEGADDLVASIMSPEGVARMRAYLDGHPALPAPLRRRVVMAFLDKFALEDEIEMELDLPGWDEDYIEELTDIYDDDVAMIATLPGVTLITP